MLYSRSIGRHVHAGEIGVPRQRIALLPIH